MDYPDLSALVAKWQPILRLQDWDITAIYERHFAMDDGKQGGVKWLRRLKQARIRVLDPSDYGVQWQPQDVEATVVHEMLHVHFALVDDYVSLSLDLFEQSIEAISLALIRLDRQTLAPSPHPRL